MAFAGELLDELFGIDEWLGVLDVRTFEFLREPGSPGPKPFPTHWRAEDLLSQDGGRHTRSPVRIICGCFERGSALIRHGQARGIAGIKSCSCDHISSGDLHPGQPIAKDPGVRMVLPSSSVLDTRIHFPSSSSFGNSNHHSHRNLTIGSQRVPPYPRVSACTLMPTGDQINPSMGRDLPGITQVGNGCRSTNRSPGCVLSSAF